MEFIVTSVPGGLPVFSPFLRSRLNLWHQSRLHYFLLGLALCLVLGGVSFPWSAPGLAQSAINRATVTEILDSNQVFIQNNQARVNDVANRGQRIRTAQARANLTYNTGAVVRLLANSSLTVGECARLDRGVTLISGAVNGCTASVTAGVRGTTYLMEVDEEGNERVKVLEGEVIVSRQAPSDSPSPDSSATEVSPATPVEAPTDDNTIDNQDTDNSETANEVVLTAGQKVESRRGDRRLGPVQQLSNQEFLDILRGELISGFAEQLPGLSRIREAFQRLYPNVPFPINAPSLPIPRPRNPFF